MESTVGGLVTSGSGVVGSLCSLGGWDYLQYPVHLEVLGHKSTSGPQLGPQTVDQLLVAWWMFPRPVLW